MKFFKYVAILSVLLSAMLIKADIVETTQETARIELPLSGEELADISTGGLVANRHGQSTTPTENAPAIPEPASALLLGISLLGAAMISRRRAAHV